MFKKIIVTLSALLQISCAISIPIQSGDFCYPEFFYGDPTCFIVEAQNDHNYSQESVSPSAGSQSDKYHQSCSGNMSYNLPLYKNAAKIIARGDARLNQAYHVQSAQQYMRAVSAAAYLPPHFKDSFEQRGAVERICAKVFSSHYTQQAYETDFEHRMEKLHGPGYSSTVTVCHQRAEMRRWKNYCYAGYRNFIATLPIYEDYMLELAQEYKRDNNFAEKLRSTEIRASDTILSEEKRILKKRAHKVQMRQRKLLEHYNQQRKEVAQDIFNEQELCIDACAPEWRHSNPKRAQAYEATLEQLGESYVENYSLSSQAQACLVRNGLDPNEFTSMQGNALQQELMSEIIEGVTRIAHVPFPVHAPEFSTTMYHATFKTFDCARSVNAMGDCWGASHLIDLATTLVDYSVAVAQGVTEGVVQGAHEAVLGTYHMVRHPVQALKSLGGLAICLARIANDYLPLQKPLWLCSTEQERTDYWNRHAALIQNWCNLESYFKKWWKETPSREKIRQVTKEVSCAVTNALVGHQCMQFAQHICKLAATETALLLRRAEQAEICVVGAQPDLAKVILNGMEEAERVAEVPATTLCRKIQSSEKIIEYGKKLGLSAEKTSQSLIILEEEGWCIERFNQAIEKLSEVSGCDKNINTILKSADKSAIKGSFFELESSLQAVERGEVVLSINEIIFGREFDVVTATELIECKNYYWPYYIDKLDRINKLKSDLGDKLNIAIQNGKKFCLHSSLKLPEELKGFKAWLSKKGIILYEG